MEGKVELVNDPKFINSPKGRYEAWLKRDDKYCRFHPLVHPDNIKDILLKNGSTSKEVKKVIEVTSFKYCPRCFAIAK
jgi:hypothetical protein